MNKVIFSWIFAVAAFGFCGNVFAQNSVEEAIEIGVSEHKDVLVIFTAPWCKYCHVFKNEADKGSVDLSEYIVYYADIDKYPEFKDKYQVGTVPDFRVFRERKPIAKKLGFVLEEFKNWLKKWRIRNK